ncbi:MAG TPA: multicopper oxidase domain-containing protein [Pyrinomonadaceae bacterium]
MNGARAFTPSIRFLIYLTICCALVASLHSITLGQEQSGATTQETATAEGTQDAQPASPTGDSTSQPQPGAASELPNPCETAMCEPGELPTASPTPFPTPIPVPTATPIPSPTPVPSPVPPPAPTAPSCNNTVVANVVAFDQVYTYNRFGAFNPAGMMFALRRDVTGSGPGNVQLRPDKRPRPIVLRVNEGDCLQVNFTNLLAQTRPNNDSTFTRYASLHVNGLDYVNGPNADDGANVGKNSSTLVAPGDSRTYKWYAAKEGQYLLYSMGAPAGGEGDGGQLDLGLFGSVNVEPKGAKWYRSQVTAAQLAAASPTQNPNKTPQINYEARYPDGTPVLNMLQGNEIIYTDVNAIITGFTENCVDAPPSSTCGQSFREFTVIFHDEIKAVQAFPELDQEVFHGVRDGFAINYGSGGMGAIVLANRKKVGPAAKCAECKYEEFFLESHPNNDPALIVRKDPTTGKAVGVLFPDDPANVVHSYLGDPVRFRNLHAGPKETHVFHLHAHQWLQSPRDENSTYLDSQTISPGAAFTYEINYGGGGNRNFTPGDAIFHCHLYPHFAQGMWELWRNHDVFEAGTADRNLPDGEIAGGTPNPAIVPIPDRAMPPMPTPTFKGYPFYIPAQAGHRSPQPPLDIEVNGGLPRHRVLQGATIDGKPAVDPALLNDPVASRVASQSTDPFLFFFARVLTSAQIELLPQNGTAAEVNAMNFHQGTDNGSGLPGVPVVTKYGWPARGYQSYTASGAPGLFLVNGQPPKPGAPYADPCSPTSTLRPYRAAYIQFDMTVNRAGWHDRQARITTLEADALPTLNGTRKPEPLFFRVNSGECVTFSATNLVPSVLNLDDFQIFTPTDIIGQHIHLVKFDVTSSDGAGNGWNYEDGGFSPGEVRERIAANNAFQQAHGGTQILTAQPHPVFGAGPGNAFLGAQTTVQRWWADPLLNNQGQDRTIRTVFTHDHFSPSSHQHHGLYGALVVEPPGSQWAGLDNQPLGGRYDGGPTSFAANIIPGPLAAPDQKRPYREFNLAFGDFAIVYTADLKPVNPPGFMEAPLPIAIEQPPVPKPESISAGDPGTQLVNYRNEPIPLRIGQETAGGFVQKTDPSGDMANVFNSNLHGDPFTPLLMAFENERVQVRLIQGAQEEQHVFNIHGVKWLFEPSAPNSGFRNGQQIGISEHFEFELNPSPLSPTVVGGANAIDRLYSSAATDNLWDGQWGILRTFQGAQALVNDQLTGQPFTMTPLPGTPQTQRSSGPNVATPFNSVCPAAAPLRSYSVSAWAARDLVQGGKLEYNKRFGIADPNAIIFIENSHYNYFKSGWARPEPLVLRAAAGECIQVTLTNRLPTVVPEGDSWNHMPAIINHFNFNQVKTSNRVGLHPQLVAYDVATSDGARVGLNPDTTVGPGNSITYTWYAGENTVDTDGRVIATPMEFGATGLRDMGDVIKHASHGATGMLIIEPAGSNWISDFTNGSGSNASANVFLGGSSQISFREHAVIYQDDLSVQQNGVPLKNVGGEDDAEDTGFKAFNYRSEPIWARMGLQVTDVPNLLNDVDLKNVLSSTKINPGCGTSVCGDPETMVYTAIAGTPTRFRVIQGAGHPRQHGFTLFGHHWQFEPWTANSTVQGTNPFTFEVGSYSGIGPTRHDNILTNAGGLFSRPGDYLYRTQESFQFTNGLWGIFRVTPR